MFSKYPMSLQIVPPLLLLTLPHLSGRGIFLVLPDQQRDHKLQSSLTLMHLVLWAKFLGKSCLPSGMGMQRSGKGT